MTTSSQITNRTSDLATEARTSVEQVNGALDEILQARVAAMALPASVERCLQLAELADVEAAWWEESSERSRSRVYWRAALAAREHAQHIARHWRRRAAAQQVSGAAPLRDEAEVR